ncbi:hypothetical protein MTO96_049277 [Rhipicephalus appendiculatus]
MKNLKADFGFDSDLFSVLREKLLACPERERLGVLMFDEMSVRKSLHLRESDMKLVGKVDFREHTRPSDNERDADHVLLFLFRPFLAGAIVDAMTCDNSTSNRSALRSLGICGEMGNAKTSFEHPCDPSRVIYSVIDPPHIFKCTRNNLPKVGKFLLPRGQEVYHSDYAALLEYEEEQAGLLAVPKLTKAHVSPNAFQKLSVKLAVQLFSVSTAEAMEFYSTQDGCEKLHHSSGTSQFTRQMNSLFDCLNSRRPEHVQYEEADHIATLKESLMWLDSCCKYLGELPKQRRVCFLSKPTCEALRITLLSTISLLESLISYGFRYVLVGNFGQDPLERFFGIVRHDAGDGGQPTVQQFLFIYRMLSVNNLVQPPKRASVAGDGPQLLLKLQNIFYRTKAPIKHVSKALLTKWLLEDT